MGGLGSGRVSADTLTLADYPSIGVDFLPPRDSQAFASITVPVVWAPCNFGGERPFLVCRCGKRAMRLYRVAGHYVCRVCAGAPYKTQLLSPLERAERTFYRFRRLAFGCMLSEREVLVPERPEYMHHRTYRRLIGVYGKIGARLARLRLARDAQVGVWGEHIEKKFFLAPFGPGR